MNTYCSLSQHQHINTYCSPPKYQRMDTTLHTSKTHQHRSTNTSHKDITINTCTALINTVIKPFSNPTHQHNVIYTTSHHQHMKASQQQHVDTNALVSGKKQIMKPQSEPIPTPSINGSTRSREFPNSIIR